MKPHPYLRAYLAGIAVPTVFLLMVLSALVVARHVFELSIPVERVAVFPMAFVPNAWGVWNVLYVALAAKRRLPLGLHGALLAVILPFLAYGIARALGHQLPAFAGTLLVVAVSAAIIVYYLAWKHLVGFLNELLGIHG